MLKRNNRELGYAKTLTVFVPKLKKAGASDEVLRQIMNDNPRRFFGLRTEGQAQSLTRFAVTPPGCLALTAGPR